MDSIQKDIEKWAESNKPNGNVAQSKKTVKHEAEPNKKDVLKYIDEWAKTKK